MKIPCALSALLLLLPLPVAAEVSAWQLDRLVPGALFKGIHGLAFGPDAMIYVGSVMGQSIYRVDPATGAAEVFVPPPIGQADDIEFAPDGTMYWTGFTHGTLNAQSPGGEPRVIASGLPGLNSLALNAQGRLFATQVFAGDALWEFDPAGSREPRLVMRDLGGLNGFDFAPDGRLCGPLWFKKQVVCIDVDSTALEIMNDEFSRPAAANFNSRGELVAIDNETGGIYRIDMRSHRRELLATAPSNLDNLAFDAGDRLFVSNMSDNAIYALEGSSLRTVTSSPLSLPGGIAVAGNELIVADTFSLSAVDLGSGKVRDISRSLADNGFPTTVAVSTEAKRIASASFESGTAQLWDLSAETVIARWGGLALPSAIAVIDADRIAVTEIGAGGRLLILDRRQPQQRTVLADKLGQPQGLLRVGELYLVSEAAAGRVVEIDQNGSLRLIADGLQHPEGLALLPDGRLAVAETGAARMVLIDPQSGSIEVAAAELPLGMADIPGYPPGIFPTGVASDASGAIYFSSDRDGGILRLRAASGLSP